jgi:hypothetical protein
MVPAPPDSGPPRTRGGGIGPIGSVTGSVGSGRGAGAGAAGAGATGSTSQARRSLFGRLWRPFGPFTQVVPPSVNAVKLSAFRQTSRPPVVSCSVLPLSGLKRSFSRQAPTVCAPTRSRSVAKPCSNVQAAWPFTWAAPAPRDSTTATNIVETTRRIVTPNIDRRVGLSCDCATHRQLVS